MNAGTWPRLGLSAALALGLLAASGGEAAASDEGRPFRAFAIGLYVVGSAAPAAVTTIGALSSETAPWSPLTLAIVEIGLGTSMAVAGTYMIQLDAPELAIAPIATGTLSATHGILSLVFRERAPANIDVGLSVRPGGAGLRLGGTL